MVVRAGGIGSQLLQWHITHVIKVSANSAKKRGEP
jgi:hypothetical protein